MNSLERAGRIGVEGFLHCEELEALIDLACDKDVLEIGSFRGLSAWGMAAVAKHLWCVDTFSADSAGQSQMSHLTTLEDFQRAISRYTNVDYFVGTSQKAIEWTDRLDFDFIFIDAMHTYPEVKSDIGRWLSRVRPRGILAFHDYGHSDFPGVKQAVDELLGQPPNVVITLAWFSQP